MKQRTKEEGKARLFMIKDLFDNDHEKGKNCKENHVLRLCRKELIKKQIFEPLNYTGGRKQSYAPERKAEMKVVKLLMTALINAFLKMPGALRFTSVPVYIQRFCQGSSGNMDQLLVLLANAVVVIGGESLGTAAGCGGGGAYFASVDCSLTTIKREKADDVWVDTMTTSGTYLFESLSDSDRSDDDSSSTTSSSWISLSTYAPLSSDDRNATVTHKTVQEVVESMQDITNCRVFCPPPTGSPSKVSSCSSLSPSAGSGSGAAETAFVGHSMRSPILTLEELRTIETRIDEELALRYLESEATIRVVEGRGDEEVRGGSTSVVSIGEEENDNQENGEHEKAAQQQEQQNQEERRSYAKQEWPIVEKYLRIFATEVCFATVVKPTSALVDSDIFKSHNHESKSNMLQFKKRCNVTEALVPMSSKFQSFRRRGEKEAFKQRVTHLLNAVLEFEVFDPHVPWGLPLASQLPLDNIILWLTDFLTYKASERRSVTDATAEASRRTIRRARTSSFALSVRPPRSLAFGAGSSDADGYASSMHSLKDIAVKNAICNIGNRNAARTSRESSGISTEDIDSLLNGTDNVQWIFDEEPADVRIGRKRDGATKDMSQLCGVSAAEITRLLLCALTSKITAAPTAPTTMNTTSVSSQAAASPVGGSSSLGAKTLVELISEHNSALSAYIHPNAQLYTFLENVAVIQWGAAAADMRGILSTSGTGTSGIATKEESAVAAAAASVSCTRTDTDDDNTDDKLVPAAKRRRTELSQLPPTKQYRWTTQTEANIARFLNYADTYFNADCAEDIFTDNFFGED